MCKIFQIPKILDKSISGQRSIFISSSCVISIRFRKGTLVWIDELCTKLTCYELRTKLTCSSVAWIVDFVQDFQVHGHQGKNDYLTVSLGHFLHDFSPSESVNSSGRYVSKNVFKKIKRTVYIISELLIKKFVKGSSPISLLIINKFNRIDSLLFFWQLSEKIISNGTEVN